MVQGFLSLDLFYYFYTINLIHTMQKTINFPIDFSVSENPFLLSTNYFYVRENGSIISIIETKRGYEVWDERHMEFPEIMSYQDLFEYLQKEPIRKLISEINWN